MISRNLFFEPELDPNSYLSPPKKRRVSQGSPIVIPDASKIQKIMRHSSLFSLCPSPFKPDYGRKQNANDKVMPAGPNRYSQRPSINKITPQFQHANCAWNQFPETPKIFRSIGKGFFHEIYEHIGQPLVYKIPNLKEITESAHNNKCFRTIQNMQTDYKALMQAQKSGLFPQEFRLAKTTFIAQHAIIVQEKCDRMLEVNDLQNPILLNAIQKLFILGLSGFHNMDLSRQNLGLSKNGELILIDFREEKVENAGTFEMNMDKFLRTYAEGDADIFHSLDPRI